MLLLLFKNCISNSTSHCAAGVTFLLLQGVNIKMELYYNKELSIMNSYIIVLTLWFGKACYAVHRHLVSKTCHILSPRRLVGKRVISGVGNLLVCGINAGPGLNHWTFLKRKTRSLNQLGYIIGSCSSRVNYSVKKWQIWVCWNTI